MTPSNSMCEVPNYGSSASYCDLPSPEQIRAGVVPLDSLPAAWWNAMWACTNGEVNKARDMLGQLITELNNVLCNAGVCVCSSCTDQLYQSINKIRQTLANATTAGAVKSSSQPSEVAVDVNGYMSVNCLGNAASLTTSASTVVGAINELKSTYDCCFTDTATAIGGKAPTSHASTATTYGVGNADNYGHLKISDTYTSVLATCSGVAASQKAVACVYAYATGVAAGIIALGNTAGCALGTAAAGSATTSARSDHVHPLPTKFGTVCSETSTFGTQLMASRSGSANLASVGFKNCLGILGYIAQGTVDAQFVRYNAAATTCYTILDTSKTITIAQGGTGATTAANARTCLGLGSAATCAATAFRSSTWTPSIVSCARTVWNRPDSTEASKVCNAYFYTGCTNASCAATNYAACICGSNGWMYGLAGVYLPTIRANDPGTTASKVCSVTINAYCTNSSGTKTTRTFVFCGSDNKLYANICGGATTANRATCADANASGVAFGSAATCAATAFRSCTWWPNSTSCGCVCCAAKASDAVFATGACCSYNHRGYTFPFPGNCNQCIRGVYICCHNCCNGQVCFINCTCAPKIVTYARFTSGGYTRGGFLMLTCGESFGAGDCWGWNPSCNCFTIYEFSAT